MVAMLALSLGFVVAAQDSGDTAVSEQTREQAKLMVTSHGAKVRLMQLQYSLQRQIMVGERIIQRAHEINDSFDSTELEIILEEMKELGSWAGSVNPELTTDEVVRDFVDLKHDVVQLSQQFRNMTRNSFTEQERNQIRDGLMDGLEAEMAQVREKIMNAIREHNEESIRNALQAMNSSDTGGLAQSARNGGIDKDQIIEQVREKVREMTSSQKAEAAQEMKRIASQRMQRAESAVSASQEMFQQRLSERVQERLERVGQSMGLTQDDITRRINQTLGPLRTGSGNTGGEDQ